MGKKTDSAPSSAAAPLELTPEEIELLERVLRKHRTTLPSYLLSMQPEISTVDAILEKLAAIR